MSDDQERRTEVIEMLAATMRGEIGDMPTAEDLLQEFFELAVDEAIQRMGTGVGDV